MKHIEAADAGLDEGKLKKLDELISPLIGSDPAAKKIPGAAVRIIRKGGIACDRYYGHIDAEQSAPVAEDSIFRIYSMTKPVTAVAAMKLFEEGAFRLSDPVKWYIPSLGNMQVLKSLKGGSLETEPADRDITIEHLLTMTSGLSYGFFPETDKLDALYHRELFKEYPGHESGGFSDADLVEKLSETPLAFHPGTDFRYSFSLDVVGRLIEILTGTSLTYYFEKEIFIPLGMKDTGFHVPEEKKDRFTRLYSYYGEEREEAVPLIDHETPEGFQSGGGGLVSTVEDYSQFCMMLLNHGSWENADIIGRKTLDLMTRNHLAPGPLETFMRYEGPGYGYGLAMRTMIDPARAFINGSVGEFGWGGAAGTWMAVDPAEELCALFMVQSFPADYYPLRRKFAQIMYSAIM